MKIVNGISFEARSVLQNAHIPFYQLENGKWAIPVEINTHLPAEYFSIRFKIKDDILMVVEEKGTVKDKIISWLLRI